MAINRMQNSLAAATNELTFAAASINFDFTLMKCEAPKEYQNLGNVLSHRKKVEAELGTAHTTAMRLGALFDGVCPPTPKLIKAYGVRASEVAESATKLEGFAGGIFSDHAGIDGTSIWASATSSSSALQVQLLACLLARIWKPGYATSIWYELVKERRREIAEKYESGEEVAFKSLSAAAKSDISRENLADWDASARAWLQVADRLKTREQTQLRLIINNVETAVNEDQNVLSGVLKAWKAAVTIMESLLNGMPQAVESGPVLLALGSWHIYPDILIAHGEIKEVTFGDKLIPPGGRFTIGLSQPSSSSGENRGIFWSLSLKHLQHYGHPVQTEARLDRDASKINFQEFTQAVFGCLMGLWESQGGNVLLACKLIASLHEAFEETAAIHDEKKPRLQKKALGMVRGKNQWWQAMASAASAFLEDDEVAKKLIRLGIRRSQRFIPKANFNLFDLCSSSLIIRGLKNPEARIAFFRRMAKSTKANVASKPPLLILYQPLSGYSHNDIGQIATAIPVPIHKTGRKRKAVEIEREIECKHQRWIHREDAHEALDEEIIYWERSDFTSFQDVYGEYSLNANVFREDYIKVYGVRDVAELYKEKKGLPDPVREPSIKDLLWLLKEDMLDLEFWIDQLNYLRLGSPTDKTMEAVGVAAEIYQAVPTASVSVDILNQPIYDASWAKSVRQRIQDSVESKDSNELITRSMAFSCIAYLGCSTNIDPDLLEGVFAMAHEESLYIASGLTCDPHEDVQPYEIQRVLGNVGRAGLTMLIPPSDPIVREVDASSWRVIDDRSFNGKKVDCLGNTSLHLSFTDYHVPLYQAAAHYRDHNVFFLESVVSVHDSGAWVGDIDILKALSNPRIERLPFECSCKRQDEDAFCGLMISVENWDGMLDPPREQFVVRSSGNWVGRLAAVAVLFQSLNLDTFQRIVICGERTCWPCYTLSVYGRVAREETESSDEGMSDEGTTSEMTDDIVDEGTGAVSSTAGVKIPSYIRAFVD